MNRNECPKCNLCEDRDHHWSQELIEFSETELNSFGEPKGHYQCKHCDAKIDVEELIDLDWEEDPFWLCDCGYVEKSNSICSKCGEFPPNYLIDWGGEDLGESQ